jgi:CBS domain containing-hemolysin-like protein
MTLIASLFLVVLATSFLCSLLEATLLSITPAFVATTLKENPRTGQLMDHLKENLDRPLSAILTLNTITQTAGSALIGALVHEEYGRSSITLFSAILTFSILILAEIIPKMIGANYWRSLAGFAIYAIQIIIFILYPIVWLSDMMGQLFKKPDEPEITREEVIATAELGADEGSLQSKESNIIKNLLMLHNIFVSDIMTPRSVMFALDGSMTVEEVFEKYRPIRFSRIPVFEGTLDNIIGLVFRHKVHETMSNDFHDVKIKDLVIPIGSVPERMTVGAALDFFIKRKEHLALAVDEYGVITGLVTLEDAVETLLGVEIVDELDSVADMRQYALEQWQMRKNQMRKS